MCKAASVQSGIGAIRRARLWSACVVSDRCDGKKGLVHPLALPRGEGLGASLLVLSVWAECVRTGCAILRGERPWGCFCPLRARRTAHAFGKNTKNMENAKELTKKYGSPAEEITII